jgi:hypothetical protein
MLSTTKTKSSKKSKSESTSRTASLRTRLINETNKIRRFRRDKLNSRSTRCLMLKLTKSDLKRSKMNVLTDHT